MVTCTNGHAVSDGEQFCGHCGVAVMTASVTCPNGHINPEDQQFCPRCGAPIAAPSEALAQSSSVRWWYRKNRKRWFVVTAGIVTVLAVVAAIVAVVAINAEKRESASTARPGSTAMRQWWSGVHDDITDLRAAVNDSRRAINLNDKTAMESACQRMHDTAAIKLQAHMPSPDPYLTAEVGSVIQDAHQAAHVCLAILQGSMAYDGGQFQSLLDEVLRHLDGAQGIADRTGAQA